MNWSDSIADVEFISILPVEEVLSKPNDAVSSESDSINAETDACEEEKLVKEQSLTFDERDDCLDRIIQVTNLVGGEANWSESGVARVEYISAVPVEEDQSGPRDAIHADAKFAFAGTEQADEEKLFVELSLSLEEKNNDELDKRIEAVKAVPATGEQSKSGDANHAEATSNVAGTDQLDEELLIEEHNGSIDEADAFEIAIQMTMETKRICVIMLPMWDPLLMFPWRRIHRLKIVGRMILFLHKVSKQMPQRCPLRTRLTAHARKRAVQYPMQKKTSGALGTNVLRRTSLTDPSRSVASDWLTLSCLATTHP